MYSSDGSEIFHHGGCSSVHGEIEEVRFDGSSFLTVKLHMRHEWSYVRSEFVILEEEKSLYSGKFSIKRPHCAIRFILFLEQSENKCECWELNILEKCIKARFPNQRQQGTSV